MTVKRSRMRRASSSDETAAFRSPLSKLTLPFPVNFATRNDVGFRKTESVPENRCQKPGIFSISSPVRESDDQRNGDVSSKMCGILDKCSYCPKIIPHQNDIFMYSCRAFCSIECRQKQIDIDEDVETFCLFPRAKRVNTLE